MRPTAGVDERGTFRGRAGQDGSHADFADARGFAGDREDTPVPVGASAAVVHLPGRCWGKKVEAALRSSGSLGPVAKVDAPKPRTSSIDRGDLPLPKVTASIPTLPPPAGKLVRPTAPIEQIPADLGQAAAQNPI